MKTFKILGSGLTTILLSFGSLLSLNLPTQAQTDKIFCGAEKSVEGTSNIATPITVFQTEKGAIPLITWVNAISSVGWTPIRHCYYVSKVLQTAASQGNLTYLRTGQYQGNPVICIVAKQGDECSQQTLLLTVQNNQDPKTFLEQLLDLKRVTEVKPVENLVTSFEGATYIDLNLFIKNFPLSEEDMKEYDQILAPSFDQT